MSGTGRLQMVTSPYCKYFLLNESVYSLQCVALNGARCIYEQHKIVILQSVVVGDNTCNRRKCEMKKIVIIDPLIITYSIE